MCKQTLKYPSWVFLKGISGLCYRILELMYFIDKMCTGSTSFLLLFYFIYLFILRANGNEAGEPYSGTHSSLQVGQDLNTNSQPKIFFLCSPAWVKQIIWSFIHWILASLNWSLINFLSGPYRFHTFSNIDHKKNNYSSLLYKHQLSF